MNCQRCFLGQMWLIMVILNNSRALPQICRGAAPICMVVVLVLKVGIGSDLPPLSPSLGQRESEVILWWGPMGNANTRKSSWLCLWRLMINLGTRHWISST